MNICSSARLLLLGICAVMLLPGCRRKQTVTPETPPPLEEIAGTEAPDAASATGSAPGPAAPAAFRPATAQEGGTTRESHNAAYIQEMTQTLNDFLADYIREKKRIPKDINEMVSLKLITSIPVLPGGKKWVINQQTGKLSAQ